MGPVFPGTLESHSSERSDHLQMHNAPILKSQDPPTNNHCCVFHLTVCVIAPQDPQHVNSGRTAVAQPQNRTGAGRCLSQHCLPILSSSELLLLIDSEREQAGRADHTRCVGANRTTALTDCTRQQKCPSQACTPVDVCQAFS